MKRKPRGPEPGQVIYSSAPAADVGDTTAWSPENARMGGGERRLSVTDMMDMPEDGALTFTRGSAHGGSVSAIAAARAATGSLHAHSGGMINLADPPVNAAADLMGGGGEGDEDNGGWMSAPNAINDRGVSRRTADDLAAFRPLTLDQDGSGGDVGFQLSADQHSFRVKSSRRSNPLFQAMMAAEGGDANIKTRVTAL